MLSGYAAIVVGYIYISQFMEVVAMFRPIDSANCTAGQRPKLQIILSIATATKIIPLLIGCEIGSH